MSHSPSSKPLEILPREVVIEALALFDFVEFEIRPTHTLMWGLRQDGIGTVIRIPGFRRVPVAAQLAYLQQAQISVEQWKFAVTRILAQKPALTPKK